MMTVTVPPGAFEPLSTVDVRFYVVVTIFRGELHVTTKSKNHKIRFADLIIKLDEYRDRI